MAGYLHNRLPGAATAGKTPFELLYGRKPSIGQLDICVYFNPRHMLTSVRNRLPMDVKLSDRAQKLLFIGFTDGIKAHKLYNPITRQVVYLRNVLFDECKVLAAVFPDSQAPVPTLADVPAELVGELSTGMTIPNIVGMNSQVVNDESFKIESEIEMSNDMSAEGIPEGDHANVDSAPHASNGQLPAGETMDEIGFKDIAPAAPPVI